MIRHIRPLILQFVLPPEPGVTSGADALWSWSIGHWTVDPQHAGQTIAHGGEMQKGTVLAEGSETSEQAARAAAERAARLLGLRQVRPFPLGGMVLEAD